MMQGLLSPKGPSTSIVHKQTKQEGYRNPFKAQICTIQLHGPFGKVTVEARKLEQYSHPPTPQTSRRE